MAHTIDEVYDLIIEVADDLYTLLKSPTINILGFTATGGTLAEGDFWPYGAWLNHRTYKHISASYELWSDGLGYWIISAAAGDTSGPYWKTATAVPIASLASLAANNGASGTISLAISPVATDVQAWDGGPVPNVVSQADIDAIPTAAENAAAVASQATGSVAGSLGKGIGDLAALVSGGAFTIEALANAPAGTGSTNATNFTGAFPSSVLVNAPTGSTLVYSLGGAVAIGAVTPIPLVAQRYSAFSLPVPAATNQAGKQHRFTVVSQTNKATVLFTLDYTHCTPGTNADGSYRVTVADTDQYTQTLQDGYWYLHNITDDLRVGEGIWVVQDGPNFGS
jgi:hypothetical protein